MNNVSINASQSSLKEIERRLVQGSQQNQNLQFGNRNSNCDNSQHFDQNSGIGKQSPHVSITDIQQELQSNHTANHLLCQSNGQLVTFGKVPQSLSQKHQNPIQTSISPEYISSLKLIAPSTAAEVDIVKAELQNNEQGIQGDVHCQDGLKKIQNIPFQCENSSLTNDKKEQQANQILLEVDVSSVKNSGCCKTCEIF